ncbi:type IX secretion system membrane protein PorP/SprF [Aequorivita sinensis]|uniref:PorP/SprF family type IX secretion system membrane protein n=1 Tax=Aequorivita sinensis TaxID=1382458 RepID=UPI002301AB1C|nr:type IX secretion system membrane protein PorP/SprF [Aequorivita sinensis]
MKKHIYILTVLMTVLLLQESQAQQDPQYTQYMYNMNVVNPAYAGSKESLSLTALYRNQWHGLEGNPVSFTFSGHSPIGRNIGLGLSAIRDEIGPVKETNVYADFSYTLHLGNTLNLALGLKAGATFHDVGLSSLELQHPDDPMFSENINNTYPNFGAGAFLYGENFYVGLSVPNLMKSVHLDENGIKYGSETNHFFATAGYVFQVSEAFKLKPSVMVKSAFDAPVSWDANLNFLFFDMIEIGGSYRVDDSFSALFGVNITPDLRFGYAYDHVTSDLKIVGPASHELILTFDLNLKPKVLRSPRFF